MAVSRPLVLALLGLVLAAATLFVTRAASESAADSAAPTVAAPVTPTPISPGAREAEAKPKPKPNAESRAGAKPADRTARKRAGSPQQKAGATPGPDASSPQARTQGVPAPVDRALGDKRVVVLFFGQGGADDTATAKAVDGLKDLKGVSIFRDGIDHVARYRGLVGTLGVAQAPAVVIVNPERQAQLVEGFIDPGTLEQLVVDAR